MKIHYPIILVILLCFSSCESNVATEKTEKIVTQTGFNKLSADETGISFKNSISEYDSLNFFNYEYIYNGGGVAVGDINNDGLDDIYFSGNQVGDKLYLNKGELKFEDITTSAIGDYSSEGWHTGVVMQDINKDGFLDIYVSRSGPESFGDLRSNLCFINNGDLTFTEKSMELGIGGNRPTTQSIFFDLENDGDLDLYIMNHPYNSKNMNESAKSVQEITALVEKGSPFSDRLLINENGIFRDVTSEAGVSNHAFGLGVAASDFNDDGFTDLYISNDYMAPDYLYMNQGDGTFKDEILTRTNHISNYSMGNDVADFNNDGLLDILTVDMVSADHIRSKKNMGGMSTKKFWDVVNANYHYQYMFNCLQMNNGDGSFSDIALMSGVAKTDWSWAPLFADFDNDGYKDLFITNGYRRDTRDNDFLQGVNPEGKEVNSFEDVLEIMPSTKIPNYIFRNKGDLTFEDVTRDWGIFEEVNSNGAAYADLDNDGDLDLIINNMDELSYVLENKSLGNSSVQVDMSEIPEGSIVTLMHPEIEQVIEYRRVRGFMSSMTSLVHFGAGTLDGSITINIRTPDGLEAQTEIEIGAEKIIAKDLNFKPLNKAQNLADPLFIASNEIDFKHKEFFVNDFEREVLLPNKMSQLGPFISKGDVNSDGHDDIYIGGSRGVSGVLMVYTENGYKEKTGPWNQQSKREELGSVFFDFDNDSDLDLYVASGSNEYKFDSEMMNDQFYVNDGKGNFQNRSDLLPKMKTSGQAVAVGDFDNDGFQDLFVGGRQTPGFYPFAPRSYLLKNNNGVFEDVTETTEALMGPGMVTDAQWIDLDEDSDLDLVVVGEWMAPTFYRNDAGRFVDISINYGTSKEVGWWNCLDTADFNLDGKVDFVFGNLGLNNKFHPDHSHPLEIYTHDFDKNGTYDIVLGKYQNGVCYPVRGKQCSTEQMPFVSQKFPTYGEFAVADLEKIYGKEELDKALHFSATNMKSSVLLSSDDGYELKKLPNRVQVAPINDVEVMDVDTDGDLDMVVIGNNYAAEVETVRYDAGIGFVLVNDGKGAFSVMNPTESGVIDRKDTKDILMVNNLLLISANNDKLTVYQFNRPKN